MLDSVPTSILQFLKQPSNLIDRHITKEDIKSSIGEIFFEKLLPYQQNGVLFGVQKEGRFCLFDEMGLGT